MHDIDNYLFWVILSNNFYWLNSSEYNIVIYRTNVYPTEDPCQYRNYPRIIYRNQLCAGGMGNQLRPKT